MQTSKNEVRAEIENLFAEFYRDNLSRLSRQMPSLMVDGMVQIYSACLPSHIFSRLSEQSENHV